MRVPLLDGTTVRLLADTGGYVIDPDRVTSLPTVSLPDRAEGVRLPIEPPMPDGHEIAMLHPPRRGADGVVSAWWFTGRTWSFDCRTGQLQLLDTKLTVGTPLGLTRSADGDLTFPFPRIQVTIEEEPIDLLLDTGASIEVTEAGLAALGQPGIRASSFIVESLFDRRQHRHPDWPVIERASTVGSPLIEVPELTVGDTTVGPVWFERRPDSNFHQWMSQWTDRRIDGALGGTAYHDRELIIDYTNALATIR